jgi:hypothetical protein
VFARSWLHPFHPGDCAGSVIGGFALHRFGMSFASPAFVLPSGRPPMNSPTRRAWMSLRVRPWWVFPCSAA